MKFVTLGLLLCCVIYYITASPVDSVINLDHDVQQPEVLITEVVPEEVPEERIRVKRFTCDVLSAEAKGVKLNDAACGIHCLALGKSGGWCDNHRVCNCRK